MLLQGRAANAKRIK